MKTHAESGVPWVVSVPHAESRVRLANRLSLDEWNGQQRVQMVVEAVATAQCRCGAVPAPCITYVHAVCGSLQ